MGRGAFSPWHIVLFAVVVLVLFGAGKLPGFARSLGQSLRIFKAEAKAMKDDDTPAVATPQGQIASMATTHGDPAVQLAAQPVSQPVVPGATPVTPPRTDS